MSKITKYGSKGLQSKGSFAVSAAGTQPSGLASKSQRQANKASIAFLFDATGSRHSSWAQAQDIQADMIHQFASGGANVEVGIVVHRGSYVEPLGWFREGSSAKAAMQKVNCEAGVTRIIPGLNACLGTNYDKKPNAIVMVGDCFEEDMSAAIGVANSMKQNGIPIHAFHESSDLVGERSYKEIARVSGGVFAKFGPEMDLRSLIQPLFVHTVQGKEAFKNLVRSGDKGAEVLASGGLLALPGPNGGN